MPASKPADESVTPDGSEPALSENVIAEGVPPAVTLNVPVALTMNVVLPALVKVGAIGVGTGITLLDAAEAGLEPAALDAVTVKV